MKWNKLIFLSISVLFFINYGCTSNSENNDDIYHKIDIESAFFNETHVNLSEFVSDLQYIPIETNDNFLLSDIMNIAISDNNISLSCESTRQVYQIDRNGRFIMKVGQQGRGPNEYIAVTELYSSPESIIVFFGRKILFFSSESGDIQKVITPDKITGADFFSGISQYGKDSLIILLRKEAENFLTVMNEESVEVETKKIWNTEKRKVNIPMPNGKQHLSEWSYSSSIYNYNGETRVTKDFIDTIFTYKNGILIPFAVFNYGSLAKKRFEPSLNLETAFCGIDVRETKNLILFTTMMGETSYIYNKENNETKRIAKIENSNYQGFTNDIDNGIPFWPVAVTSDKMYSFMSADVFIKEAEKSNSQKMKDVAATLTEESNPVIVVATLK